jgi:3-deoxy-D-manno-octulosonic-acid transferase
VDGRRHWRERYAGQLQHAPSRRLWVHAASLGEFEQGRPVIEAFRRRCPDWYIVLTFFSPSGYEIRKNYPFADQVLYMPLDTPANVRDFLNIVRPEIAIFIKYEFWYYYLTALREQHVKTLLITALFRSGQPFFKPWGLLWRQMLRAFDHIFVQNAASQQLLHRIGFQNVTIAGDTRVDRVLELAATASDNNIVAAFAQNAKVLVAGSTWPRDEAVLIPAFERLRAKYPAENIRLIVAPHEPVPAHITPLLARLSDCSVCCYSEATPEAVRTAHVLVIDNIGLLNQLYRYGWAAYIGGGFGKGIHNTLEPAAWGLPVLFGPAYQKFAEARAFVAQKGAFSVNNTEELYAALEALLAPAQHKASSSAVRAYLQAQKGATQVILDWMERR